MRYAAIPVASLITLLAVVQFAAGAGEPKNEPPFTRSAETRALQGGSTNIEIRGEAKNELPFTRVVGR
jgi:hypothetical protein